MSYRILTRNSKTIVSLDFDRFKTCPQICSYCYVATTERIYKAYSAKLKTNYELALNDPKGFAEQLNSEYTKLKNSKSKDVQLINKLPVRIYGSGDYIPIHYEFMKNLDFKFYIISKSLTLSTMEKQIESLLKLDNLTSIVLSLDIDNKANYEKIKKFKNIDRLKISFTGTNEQYEERIAKGEKYDIFFLISDKKVDREYARKFKEQCPCDTRLIAHEAACTKCNKCWRSSFTKK